MDNIYDFSEWIRASATATFMILLKVLIVS